MANAYPVVLLLHDKRAVVIGGGSVAERKVKGLLACDADVTVISPEITADIQTIVDESRCAWRAKSYEASDLEDADIVFAATDDEDVNVRVYRDATNVRLMVNVADRPELCSFYLPSVLRRGNLSIAVSTQGSSPLLARKIRKDLETQFDSVYESYVDVLHGVRSRVNESVPAKDRLAFWDQATDGRVLELLKCGDRAAAEAHLEQLLDAFEADSQD